MYECICVYEKKCKHLYGTRPEDFKNGKFDRISFCALYPDGIPVAISKGEQECKGNEYVIAKESVESIENTPEPYEKVLDQLNYDFDRVLDKYRSGAQRIPTIAASGLLFAKAIELYFEMRGIEIDDINKLIGMLQPE